MISFTINRTDPAFEPIIRHKIDNLAKPVGSLGVLESIALKVGMIQKSVTPKLFSPTNIIFAGDHGIVEEGVSISAKEITYQQVYNFIEGGAGVNFLARQHNFKLKVVDAGVDHDFAFNHQNGKNKAAQFIDKKVGYGTRNFLYEAAMTPQEMELCLQRGADVVSETFQEGCNIISFGEMGIGNTSPSSIWFSLFTETPLNQCIGAGAGLSKSGISHKEEVLTKALSAFQKVREHTQGREAVLEIIRYFGGYEMVMTIGAMLRAAELGMVILVDGFIMTACILAAQQLYPAVQDYALFSHVGDEVGHKILLEKMGVHPILSLALRLGEGTGAICCYPIVESGVRMINEMKSFEDASVTNVYN